MLLILTSATDKGNDSARAVSPGRACLSAESSDLAGCSARQHRCPIARKRGSMTAPIQATPVSSASPLRRRGWRFLNSLWLIVSDCWPEGLFVSRFSLLRHQSAQREVVDHRGRHVCTHGCRVLGDGCVSGPTGRIASEHGRGHFAQLCRRALVRPGDLWLHREPQLPARAHRSRRCESLV